MGTRAAKRPKGPGERLYPVPDGYPIPAEMIPSGMPVDTFHLYAFGRLSPDDCKFTKTKPMGCGLCGADATLYLVHEPLGPDFMKRDPGKAKHLPSLKWGEDVAVVCPCCSLNRACPHEDNRAAAAAP